MGSSVRCCHSTNTCAGSDIIGNTFLGILTGHASRNPNTFKRKQMLKTVNEISICIGNGTRALQCVDVTIQFVFAKAM